jgi:hypothetical protein
VVNGNRGFLGLTTVSDQPTDDIDQAVDWAAMAGMLNLRNILQLVNDGLNDGTLAQKQAVAQGDEAVLHGSLELGNELHPNTLQ